MITVAAQGPALVPEEGMAGPGAERAALAALCEQRGIALFYYDIWGTRREVPESGLRALLHAMGVTVDQPGAAQAALLAGARGQGEPEEAMPLPPVLVLGEDAQPASVPVAAPGYAPGGATDGAETWHWELQEECERTHVGTCRSAGDGAGPRIDLPVLPPGYHRVTVYCGESKRCSMQLVIAPARCHLPPVVQDGGRVWGWAVQLYALRSRRNWGMGDFTDLENLVRLASRHGAGFVGLNPLHALHPDNPAHASPYSPSSRRFLDVFYLDVEAVADFSESAAVRRHVASQAFQKRLAELRAAELVDYIGVAAAKLPVLGKLYDHFRRKHLSSSPRAPRRHGDGSGDGVHPPAALVADGEGAGGGTASSPRGAAFREFQRAGGLALRRYALYETLQEHFRLLDANTSGWTQWPEAYRDPGSRAVIEFAQDHAERVEFFEYLQWLADIQIGRVQDLAREFGMGVGLYCDLAVSVDLGGADVWAERDLYACEASAGCPPDDFNLRGQDWGLPPMLPDAMRERGYAPFIAVLRANMRRAGALRIDHVMGLARLFWVPRGGTPEAGGYVAYPFEDLLGIVALESRRSGCMVIGEDLGTVPDEVREGMARKGILSYRVLYFSRRHTDAYGDIYVSPAEFPADALVTATTHDLATLAGFWDDVDLQIRAQLDLFPSDAMRERLFAARKEERKQLLWALQREGLLPEGASPEPLAPEHMTPELAMAIQEYLARAPARMQVVQAEDVLGCREQANLPGTVDEVPNWRRKLPVDLEDWGGDARFLELAKRLTAARSAA